MNWASFLVSFIARASASAGVAVAGVVLMGDVFVFLYKSSEVGDSVG